MAPTFRHPNPTDLGSVLSVRRGEYPGGLKEHLRSKVRGSRYLFNESTIRIRVQGAQPHPGFLRIIVSTANP